MKPSRNIVFLIGTIGLLSVAHDAHAVRYAEQPLLWRRTAVSGYGGVGYPVGVFASDDIVGDGNHEANRPLDWAIEIEHFAGRTWSLGFSAAFTTYDDQDIPTLHTNLNTYSGFVRIVVPTATDVRPYLRAGMGAVQVEFEEEGQFRVDAEYSFSFQAGAGLLWLPARWLGLNAQALYYWGDTQEAYIAENNSIVGFNTEYFAFSGGLSLFFP